MKKIFVCLIVLILSLPLFATNIPVTYQRLIDQGEFSIARQLMRMELATNLALAPCEKQSLSFEIERLERIKKDFIRSQEYIINYISEYIPDVTETDLTRWELEKSLEYKIIDGEKKYFQWAGPNLFRINKKAKKIKQQALSKQPEKPDVFDLDEHNANCIELAKTTGNRFVNPVRFRINYTLIVNKNVVPNGEIIRCWLPYPREVEQRQTDVTFVSSEPAQHLIADNERYLQRSIYLEKPANKDQQTTFKVSFEYTGHAVYNRIDPKKVVPANVTDDLKPYVSERTPHIVFTPKLRVLSKQIVADEKNPFRIAQKIYKWIDENIPWASAREYSTFYNVSDYVYENGHGDCGMKTIFFMTLCRMNGIPTRWQSGWGTEPGAKTMHDWGQIWFDPYGWVPVDMSYGLRKSTDDKVKWFYLGSMDSYRLIVNDAYSQQFYPAKIHHRSETIDFQRGEVEWRGGNLYFDQWDYDFDVEIISE